MLAKDIKRGSIVSHGDAPCMVESVTVQTPSARGANTLYKFRARNLITKQKVDVTLRGGESLDEADFERHPAQYMYADVTFDLLGAILWGILALIYNEQCVGIQLPLTVQLRVVQCDPGVKGDSATGRTKPATLQTGLVVQVPEYLSEGERVKVDTRTGQFLSRA